MFSKDTADVEFVDVVWRSESTTLGPASLHGKKTPETKFYGDWIEQASAKHSAPEQFAADELQKLYPNHSLVMTSDYRLHVLNYPGVTASPIEASPLLTELVFFPLARRLGGPLGVVVDSVEVGAFNVTWEEYQFIVYITQWPVGFGNRTEYFILHEGSDEPTRQLLVKVGIFAEQLHDEIWVFNQGFWDKSRALWEEIQKANWADVILKPEYKKAIQKDVYGFFSSQEIYRQLAIPWKRGIIMYGPPGNGKTISLKAIMKDCDARGFTPLYVKSFQSWKGEEGAMADVFDKARQVSPCVIILEDLDSLINDRNRSFFLNQMDGLEGNDGLMVIGTTNHFDRLDPGLSTRPSRFDRKFLFDDPDRDERALYAKYWQHKLASNKDIDFPDSLIDEVADLTTNFSFAYLKEAFVSTLVTLAGQKEDENGVFADLLKSEIKTLRKQLDKSLLNTSPSRPSPLEERTSTPDSVPSRAIPSPPPPSNRDIRVLLDTLSDYIDQNDRVPQRRYSTVRGTRNLEVDVPRDRDVRPLLDELAEFVERCAVRDSRPIERTYVTRPSSSVPQRVPRQHTTRDGRPFEWDAGNPTRKVRDAARGVTLSDRTFTGGDYTIDSLGSRL